MLVLILLPEAAKSAPTIALLFVNLSVLCWARPWQQNQHQPLLFYLRAIYDGVGYIYAPFMSNRLH
jgi:hypothetical protein